MDITRLLKNGVVGVHSQEDIGKKWAVVQRVPDDVVMEDLFQQGGGYNSGGPAAIVASTTT